MRFLRDLFGMFKKPAPAAMLEAPHAPAAPAPAPDRPGTEHRHALRVPFGGKAQLEFAGVAAPVPCEVLDASRDGLRVQFSAAPMQQPLEQVSIFFNGYVLRTKVRVAWLRQTAGAYEVGLRLAPRDIDMSTLDRLMSYLSWKASLQAA